MNISFIEVYYETNSAPTQSTPILNSSSGTNRTVENLTVHVNISDVDGDSVKGIVDWRIADDNLSVLNAPFEAGENATNTTKDYSVYGNDGVVRGSAFSSAFGHDGFGSYVYDGSDDFIEFPNYDVSNGYTISLWVWLNHSGTTMVLDYGDNNSGNSYKKTAQIFATNGNTLNFRVGNGSANAVITAQIEQQRWTHIVAVHNMTNTFLYKNGTLVATGSRSPIYVASTGHLRVGGQTDGSFDFNGSIDDLQLFNRSLSAEQVSVLYNRSDLIVSQETSAGEVWQACVTPNDGNQDGGEKCSNTLTILANAPPSHNTPILNSSSGTNGSIENLTVHNVSTADVDGDEVKNIVDWRLNTTNYSLLNAPFEGGDNASNFTTDYSILKQDGVVRGATFNSTAGHDGFGTYQYDGNNDFIEFPNYDISNGYTISMWVWLNSTGTTVFADYGDNNSANSFKDTALLFATGGDTLKFRVGNGTANNGANGITAPISQQTWTHVAAVHNTTNVFLYKNGTLISTNSIQSVYVSSNGHLRLGGQSDGAFDLNGQIDDFALFNRTLSAEQIALLANNRTDLLISNETAAGDVWQACITPNDRTQDGEEKCSNTLTILENAPPSHGTPILNASSTSNTTSDNLTVYPQNVHDAEGETVKNVTDWRVNGRNYTLINAPFEGRDNTSNFTTDYSISKQDGTVRGATFSSTSGHDGFGAYTYDGNNDFIEFPSYNVSGGYTISLWVWLNDSETAMILDYGDNNSGNSFKKTAQIFTVNGNSIRFRVGNGSANNGASGISTSIQQQVWTHVVAVHNTTDQLLYINGTLIGTTSLDDIYTATAGHLRIGGQTDGNFDFNGTIDEFTLYNDTLTPEQISALYTTTNTLVSNETTTGETWQACITPNDRNQNGQEKCSNNLTIT